MYTSTMRSRQHILLLHQVSYSLGGDVLNYHVSFNFINIIILVYLMIDAPKKGKSQILWGILGFLFGPIALAIYLFKTGNKTWGYIWLAISMLGLLVSVGFMFFALNFVHQHIMM